MNKITKLEDIEAWQDARILAKTIYKITAYEQLDKVQRKLSAFIKVLRNNAINSITR